MAKTKEPFIPQSDRPEVKIDPDKAVGNLTVRELSTILGSPEIFKLRKDGKESIKDFIKEHFKEHIKEFIIKESHKDVFDKLPDIFTNPGDPGPERGGITQLVEHVGGLHKKIDELSDQIAELKKSR